MRKATRPASGTSKPYSHIPDTRYYKGVGCNGSNGNLLPGTISGGKMTPPMMIPGGNPKEVLDSLHIPMTPAPGLLSEH